jgi:hypothetical protein
MSLIELHPEELLSRAQNGTLTAAERRDLGAHLRRCPACAAEKRWGADAAAIEREQAAPDRARAARVAQVAQVERLVAAVMNQRRRAATATMEARPRPRRTAVVMALVASGCLLSGAAAATLWPAARRLWVGDAELQQAPGGARRPAPARVQPAAPTVPELPAPPPEVPPAIAPAKLAAKVRGPAPAAAPDPAAALFGELARARRAGRLVEARLAHDRLAARFPGTREELTGRLLVAQLALRRDEPALALDLFERYLGTDVEGALAEEARLGRALALERLGREADERRAWRELLERHPHSLHTARARTRLETLGAPPR